ncbi:hypothetical protein [Ensifer sp. MJa1]|uniref:hypothetical protein n=1 Tax=Ensifer sp. MJa1 TaxID=2919888 RepID=UPI003008451A
MESIVDLPNWLFYAAIGACFGVAGGIVGWLLDRGGRKWARWIPVVTIALSAPVTREFVEPRLLNARVVREVEKMQWVSTLKTEMPDEYARVIGEFVAIAQSATTGEEEERRSGELTRRFFEHHRPNLPRAPDDLLARYLESYIALMKTVRLADGLNVCAQFAVNGQAAIQGKRIAYLNAFDDLARQVVVASAASIRAPRPVEAATADDWAAVASVYLESGGSAEGFSLLENQDASSPALCDVSIDFLQAVVDTAGPSGLRVRTEMTKVLVGS